MRKNRSYLIENGNYVNCLWSAERDAKIIEVDTVRSSISAPGMG